MRSLPTCLAMALAAALLGACAAAPPVAKPELAALEVGLPLDIQAARQVPRKGIRGAAKGIPNAEYNRRIEADELGPPSAMQLLRAQAQREGVLRTTFEERRAKAAGLQPWQWQPLGPSNVAGRVRALAFDPRDASRLFAGTASGGLWLSQDAGTSWRPINDFNPNLSITAIAFDRANPNAVYIGTGESTQALVGVGMFKSEDSGLTWRHLPATNPDANGDWRFVNRIAMHPSQPQVLLAALTNNARSGGAIYRSTDGGTSWVRSAPMHAMDIAFDPYNPANALAGLFDGTIAYSRDGGVSWTRTAALVPDPNGTGGPFFARSEIAFAAGAPGVAYASVDNNKGEVWRSDDSGATWRLVSTPEHLQEQGWYDNAIWIDPANESHVVVAGIDIHRSRDGGASFTLVSDRRYEPDSPHADHHALVSPPDFGPGRRRLFNGNDGGVYRALDVDAVSGAPANNGWRAMNNGLAVTQFYSGAGRAAAGGRVIGGTQDNGSLMLAGLGWSKFFGGDGGSVAVDPANDNILYGEYVFGAVHRSTDGGRSADVICRGITEGEPDDGDSKWCGPGATRKSNFIAPFVLDPGNSNRLLVGAASLWVTDNARASQPAWRVLKEPSTVTGNYISAVTVAPRNSGHIWVGHNNGEIYRTTQGGATTAAWTRLGAGVLPARLVLRIHVDPDNASRAIVAFSGFVPNNVWQTNDDGATWSSITSNLPAAPVFDVERHAQRSDWLYAATSVGIFTSENRGQSWSTTNEGPANIRVRELFWIDDNTLGAATFGRGMFKAALAPAGASSYADLWWGGVQENGWGMSIAQHGNALFAAIYIYDAQGNPTWVTMTSGVWDAGFTTYTGALYAPTGSWWGTYDPARFSVGAPVGQASLRFDGLDNATLSYTVNGVSGVKSLTRNAFGPPDATPMASYGDLWWGGEAQNGWGLTIAQQYRTLFLAWYTYDSAGRATWFYVSGGEWLAANVFRGRAYRSSGSPWLGVPYDAGRFSARDVGEVILTFSDPSHAMMSYTIDGVTQSKPISRFIF